MQLRPFIIISILLCLYSFKGWAQPTAGFTITGLPNTTGPVPAANGGTLKICINTVLTLKDESTYTGATPIQFVTYTYNKQTYKTFPGGSISNIPFTVSDTLKQEVTDYDGNKSTVKMYVSVSTTYPVAAFAVKPDGPQCGYNDFTFTSTSTGSGLTYNWNFTGSTVTTSTNNPAVIKFDGATGNGTGAYPVTLQVTNSGGCSNAITKNVQVNQIPDIRVKDNKGSGLPVIYNNEPVFTACNVAYPYELTFFDNTTTSNTGYKVHWSEWYAG